MPDDNPRNERRHSLYPLDVEEALRRAMAAGKPEDHDRRGTQQKPGKASPKSDDKK